MVIPPFAKLDDTVVIGVDIVEEAVEARVGHGQAGTYESGTQLVLIEVAVMVSVYALEQRPELSFGLINKFAKLFLGSADGFGGPGVGAADRHILCDRRC